jgi:hypothetical protein
MSSMIASPGSDSPASMRSIVCSLRPIRLASAAAVSCRALQTRRKLRPKTTPDFASLAGLRGSDRDLLRRPLVEYPFLERLGMIALICVIEECYIRITGVTPAATFDSVRPWARLR